MTRGQVWVLPAPWGWAAWLWPPPKVLGIIPLPQNASPPAPPQATAGCMKPLCKISIKAPTPPMGTDRQQRGTGVTQREAEVLARAAAAQRRGTGTPFCP